MSCRSKCGGGFHIINSGSSLVVPTVVRAITTSGSKLAVTNTDGSSYELELPKAEPANVEEVKIFNASGTQLVSTVAKLKGD